MSWLKKIKGIYIVIAIAVAGIAVAVFFYRCVTQKRVVVVFSYDSQLYNYISFRKELEDAFRKNKQNVDIEYYYLNCLNWNHDDEIRECRSILAEACRNGEPDVILTIGDEVTYSMLHTYEPVTKTVPMVFGSVFYPNWGMIAKHTNVTGFEDDTDIASNIRMAPQLCGTYATYTMLSDRVLDHIVRKKINKDLAHCKDIIDNTNWQKPLVTIFQNAKEKKLSITPFSLVNVSLNTRDEENKESQGSSNMMFVMNTTSKITYVQMKYDKESMSMVSHSSKKPMLTAVWFGFGEPESKFIGGYMASGKTIANDVAGYATRILRGTAPADIPFGVHKKEKFIDWQVAKKNGFTTDNLPEGYSVVNLPFSEKHPALYKAIVTLAILLAVVILSVFSFLFYIERKRRREATEATEKTRNLYEMAVSESLTFAWERHGEEYSLNDAFWKHYGHEPHRVTQQEMKRYIHPDFSEDYERGLRLSDSGEPHILEIMADFGGKGQYHWYQVRSRAIVDYNGKVRTKYGIIMKIDDFKKREQELIEARKKAEAADMKEAFLANMTHEIRTPLNAIVGGASILATPGMDLTDEEKATFMDAIMTNNESLLKLINDILEITAIDSGQKVFQFSKHSLNAILDKACEDFRHLIPQEIRFEYHRQENDCAVNTDDYQLLQVLRNLLSNAGKCTSEGSVDMGWEYLPASSEVRIYVKDTGKGLSPQEQKNIFNRFYKTDDFVQGAGLGLSICQAIVHRLEGSIEVDSEKGKGSMFSVILKTE